MPAESKAADFYAAMDEAAARRRAAATTPMPAESKAADFYAAMDEAAARRRAAATTPMPAESKAADFYAAMDEAAARRRASAEMQAWAAPKRNREANPAVAAAPSATDIVRRHTDVALAEGAATSETAAPVDNHEHTVDEYIDLE